jgi:hypothetical protein
MKMLFAGEVAGWQVPDRIERKPAFIADWEHNSPGFQKNTPR